MSRIFDFKKRFGQTIDLEEVRRDFLNKIKHFLIDPLDEEIGWSYSYSVTGKSLFDFVAIEFNQDPAQLVSHHNQRYVYATETYRPSLNIFSGGNFESTMLLIEILYDYFSRSGSYGYGDDEWQKKINTVVQNALTQPASLGISWQDGKFYPEGVEEFNEKLIEDVLKWLKGNPKVSVLYKNAIDHYSQSISDPVKRKDVFSNAFQAVEKLTQEYLKTSTLSFDKNFNALVDKLVIDKEWKKIFNSYRELSKEFGRHAGVSDKFIPNQEDTEAFLYLSGLIMRLILQKLVE
jgi:hypothetical protein